MEILLLIMFTIAVFAPIFLVGRWILSPIDRAARYREAPVRFSIGDVMCLFLAVQIPLTVIYQFVAESEERPFWIFTIVSWIIAPVIWFACARVLSKAGVTSTKHRFVFLGLIMPVVYYGLIPFVVLTIVGLVQLTIEDAGPIGKLEWIVAAWLAIAAVFILCGLFTRWMIRQARYDEPPPSEREDRLEFTKTVLHSAPLSRCVVNRPGEA